MSPFHPSNEILLTAYQTISLASRYLLNGLSKDLLRTDYLNKEDQVITVENQQDPLADVEYLLKELKYCLVAIGFSYLALGSILHFTKVRNTDTGQYEELIGWSLYRLYHLTIKLQNDVMMSERSSEQQELLQQLTQLFSPEVMSCQQFAERMTSLVSLCLRSCQYHWGGDPRVIELLCAASQYPSQCYQESQPLYEAFISSSQSSIFSLS